MATKKDLVEAHAFSRRRLVTAFVSGAPGGREVEPTRPGRTVVGGLALSILLLAGAAIASVLSPRAPSDWTEGGLVVSKERGAAYVVLAGDDGGDEDSDDPVLRPVINITSAQLILGAEPEPNVVEQDEIDRYAIGEDIGILDAPATVPEPELLLQTGWTACTADRRGVKVDVSTEQRVRPAPGAGLLVRTGARHYVIAQSGVPGPDGSTRAHAYELPPAPGNDLLLQRIGLPIRREAVRVPEQWLTLFPSGGALELGSFALGDLGGPSPDAGRDGLPADARIGDVYDSGGIRLLLTEAGPVRLTAFAQAVYEHSERPAGFRPELLETSGDPQLRQATPAYAAASWPEDALSPVTGEHCAVLVTSPDEAPVVVIGTDPVGAASVEAAAVGPRLVDRSVDPGRGSYALAAGWDGGAVGSPYLLDPRGAVYPLVGAEAAERLGYGDVEPPVVPDPWIELFEEGVPLSVDAALCPPVRTTSGQPCT
ncbi:type VII secretion protein EccB [Nocardioides sp. SYSU DS0663]|uniref:type VII secretion protein EccB n=1 Tax=Nocardioides sp. SYSU DS0663 TaxID=3416445 RepID=UPI003F4BB41F